MLFLINENGAFYGFSIFDKGKYHF